MSSKYFSIRGCILAFFFKLENWVVDDNILNSLLFGYC